MWTVTANIKGQEIQKSFTDYKEGRAFAEGLSHFATAIGWTRDSHPIEDRGSYSYTDLYKEGYILLEDELIRQAVEGNFDYETKGNRELLSSGKPKPLRKTAFGAPFRECTCGSGQHWSLCHAVSESCG